MKSILYIFTITLFYFFVLTNHITAQQTPAFDSTFAKNGVGRYSFISDSSNAQKSTKILLQPDGKVITVATTSNLDNGSIIVRRFLGSGKTDSSFGVNGTFLLRDGFYSSAQSADLSPDGKIYICATYRNASQSNSSNEDFYVIALSNSGKMDSSFNYNGRLLIPVADTGADYATSIAVQQDGKIVVAGITYKGLYGHYTDTGYAFVRINNNGIFDKSFGKNGKAIIYLHNINTQNYEGKNLEDIALRNQKIILTGAITSPGLYHNTDLIVLRLNHDGKLDSTFAGKGIYNISNAECVNCDDDDRAYAVAIQGDDKILIASEYQNDRISVTRLNENGKIDSSFHQNGKFIYPEFGGGSDSYVPSSISADSNNNVFVTGTVFYSDYGMQSIIFKLKNSGNLDPSFNFKPNYDLYNSGTANLALRPGGKLWVLGEGDYYFRLNKNGLLDSSFNTDGVKLTPYSITYDLTTDVKFQENGKILVAGVDDYGSNDKFFVFRLNKNGKTDSSFKLYINNSYTSSVKIAIQPNGRIVIATGNYHIIRLNKDGSIDSSFGKNGEVQLPVYGVYQSCVGAMIQPNGKIIVAGSGNIYNYGNQLNYYAARLNSNGNLDNTFSTDGVQEIKTGNTDYSIATSVGLLSNGKIVLAGYSYDYTYSGRHNGHTSLIVLQSNGNLDNTFNTNGMLLDTLTSKVNNTKLFINDAGSLRVFSRGNSHLYVLKLNSDGSFDSTFNGDGRNDLIYSDKSLIPSVEEQDGNFLGVKSDFAYNDGIYVVKYKRNGELDSSFGKNGKYLIKTPDYIDFNAIITLQPDNKIVLAATSQFNKPGYCTEVIRLVQDSAKTIASVNKNSNPNYSKIVQDIKQQFAVYPNPAKQNLYIMPLGCASINNADINITDMNGRVIFAAKAVDVSKQGYSINIAALANGIYIIQIYTNTNISRIKFAKE